MKTEERGQGDGERERESHCLQETTNLRCANREEGCGEVYERKMRTEAGLKQENLRHRDSFVYTHR